jgi:hypothetical protein
MPNLVQIDSGDDRCRKEQDVTNAELHGGLGPSKFPVWGRLLSRQVIQSR